MTKDNVFTINDFVNINNNFMIVDNKSNTAILKISYMLMLGVLFALTSLYLFELRSSEILLFFIGGVVLTYIIFLLRKSNYLFVEYLGNKLTVRYYTAHPIFRKFKAFEIPKNYFYDYEIKKLFFGFQKTIQFKVKTPKGIFMYPPLSITLLSKNHMIELIKILNELKKS